MEAIDHVDLVVSDLQASLDFYSGLLRPLGYVQTGDIEGERGERVVYLEKPGGFGAVGLRERHSTDRAEYDRYSLGLHHLAFTAVNRSGVDECASWLRDAGAEVESGPEEKGYAPGYYAVFFFDPDGIKLEVVHRPRERDLVTRVAELEARLAELEGR